ncbi:hypothetical protein L3Q65_00795 (plasmid) [Amycolatopsis sp. FU40]|uniref:hypothetical protein n=1 Tax=Amycolatopsis sp. FU40 TaxID=2914159 RepID=UPI001F1C3152|nr:hypothetical protein [Amycolatopsis sp. FU40]UKD50863.1 hypothetical protein L3Q65_00795 [Amycolatopsis sp. FU40]
MCADKPNQPAEQDVADGAGIIDLNGFVADLLAERRRAIPFGNTGRSQENPGQAGESPSRDYLIGSLIGYEGCRGVSGADVASPTARALYAVHGTQHFVSAAFLGELRHLDPGRADRVVRWLTEISHDDAAVAEQMREWREAMATGANNVGPLPAATAPDADAAAEQTRSDKFDFINRAFTSESEHADALADERDDILDAWRALDETARASIRANAPDLAQVLTKLSGEERSSTRPDSGPGQHRRSYDPAAYALVPGEPPSYAIIHVAPKPGLEAWPVVERVPGGWQSGVHHYPDEDVIDVSTPLRLVPEHAGGGAAREPVAAHQASAACEYQTLPGVSREDGGYCTEDAADGRHCPPHAEITAFARAAGPESGNPGLAKAPSPTDCGAVHPDSGAECALWHSDDTPHETADGRVWHDPASEARQ